ncbi:MAG: hypothetical protein AAF386_07970, partial [Pseudomonadota bacterium]
MRNTDPPDTDKLVLAIDDPTASLLFAHGAADVPQVHTAVGRANLEKWITVLQFCLDEDEFASLIETVSVDYVPLPDPTLLRQGTLYSVLDFIGDDKAGLRFRVLDLQISNVVFPAGA